MSNLCVEVKFPQGDDSCEFKKKIYVKFLVHELEARFLNPWTYAGIKCVRP